MSLRPAQLQSLKWAALLGAVLALGCALLQSAPSALMAVVAEDLPYKKVSSGIWELDPSHLAPGEYYLSLGRPRGLCDLSIDGSILATTRSAEAGLRGGLTLGAPVRIVAGKAPPQIGVRCESEEGFGPSLSHGPLLLSPRIGQLAQLWRAFFELLLGPIASLALLAGLGILTLSAASRSQKFLALSWPHWLFAVIGLLYSVSLAHYPRLFLHGLAASGLHVQLRMAFSACYLLLCGHYTVKRWWLFWLHVLAAASLLFTTFAFPAKLDTVYQVVYVLIPLTAILCAWDLLAREPMTDAAQLLQPVVVGFLLISLNDSALCWLDVGVYSAPSTIAMMAVVTILLKIRDQARGVRVQKLGSEIAKCLENRKGPEDTLKSLADIIHKELNFSRITAYVDAHALGSHHRPGEVWHRLMERGYSKRTETDIIVDFRDGRGVYMQQAIKRRTINRDQGKRDRVWFLNIPLSQHACLNLSDDTPRPGSVAVEGHEILESVQPLLNVLGERLGEQGVRQGIALERLRLIRGDGTFPIMLGAVFVDINGYSKLTQTYGESFAKFVGSAYLPALCKKVRPWAVREFSRGDELYLVSIAELMETKGCVAGAAIRTLKECQNFTMEEGAELCKSAGFPVVTMSAAANWGPASLICDPFQVRTSGETVIQAARLRDAAPEGGSLLHPNLIPYLDSQDHSRLREATPILIKKTVLLAHPFIVKSA